MISSRGTSAYPSPSRIFALVLALATVVLTGWAYRPALDAGFVLDDVTSIIDNPAVHWEALSWEGILAVRESAWLPRRIVANLSFALNHLAGGLDPFGYHLINILIHLATGAALAYLIGVYLRSHEETPGTGVGPRSHVAVLVPVALFLVHPLNTQAVTYVVQRMTSLSALFALLAMALYLSGRERGPGGRPGLRYAAAALFWMLGLGTKENVLLVPLVLLTYEWCFHRAEWRERWRSLRGGRSGGLVVVAIGLLLLGGATLLLLWGLEGNLISLSRDFPNRDFSGVDRLLTQTRVHWLYLSLLVWPAPGRLNLDHDFTVSRGLLVPPSTLAAVLGIVFLIALAGYLAVNRPKLGFPLLAYFEFHAIESGPVNLEMVFEHRMYLPTAMLALALAVALCRLRGRQMVIGIPVVTVVAFALTGATRARTTTWADPLRLAEDVARKSPHKARAQSDLGLARLRAGQREEAETALLRSLAIEPHRWKTRLLLSEVYLGTGRSEKALAEIREAIRLEPLNVRPAYALGAALTRIGRTDEAFRYYLDLGTRLALEGRAFEAIEPLRQAVALDSLSSTAHNSLGNVYLMAENTEAALAEYRTAVHLDPENVEALYNLATRLDRTGKAEEAVRYYRRFLELAPPGLAAHARRAADRIAELQEGPDEQVR